MALTADKARKVRGYPVGVPYPVAASTTIYAGALVAVNSSGYLVPAANDTTFECVGVASENVDNSSGSNADLSCNVEVGQIEVFTGSGITITGVGKACYVVDDETVGSDAVASKNVHVGTVRRLVSTNVVEVQVWPQPAVTAQPT
jgi:hypothetical protein